MDEENEPTRAARALLPADFAERVAATVVWTRRRRRRWRLAGLAALGLGVALVLLPRSSRRSPAAAGEPAVFAWADTGTDEASEAIESEPRIDDPAGDFFPDATDDETDAAP